MDPKEAVTIVGPLAAVAAVILTALRFRADLRQAREQRQRDLRWRQAQAAKGLNDEMLDDEEARAALEMLDYVGRKLNLPQHDAVTVSAEEIRNALDPTLDFAAASDVAGRKLADVRYCFDSLFYYFAVMEHHITTTLVLSEDVQFPLDYYLPLLAEYREQVDRYLQHYRLVRAEAFLRRNKASYQRAGTSSSTE